MRALSVLLLAGLAAAPAAAAERPARPSLCPQDAPEGVRVPERPGCDGLDAGTRRAREGRRVPGDGVDLRIGGRVAAEFGLRR